MTRHFSCRPHRLPPARGILWSCLGLLLFPPGDLPAGDDTSPRTIDFSDSIPYGLSPIDYLGQETADAVGRLNERLKQGTAELEYAQPNGYLRAVLDEFHVPVESQLLVFSQTALNQKLVRPQNPRAIYFNDSMAVGWVPGAASLELTAIDPLKGPIFYTLEQSADKPPRFRRESRCLACHAGTTTLHVPGLMVRSFLTDAKGKPIVGYSRTTHDSLLSKRWGGWYVTGDTGRQTHSGNVFGQQARARLKADPGFRSGVTDLSAFVDLGGYESPHSDIVAHLVLDHQVHGLNLIHRAGHEARLGRRSDVEQRLVRYLLFADEPPLTDEIRGTSGYARWFAAQKPRDSRGRSLREFDLKTRLFKYRLSFLIHTPSFDVLPAEVKERLYRQLWNVLTAKQAPDGFPAMPAEERRAIIEIVRDTKSDLPDCWRSRPTE